MKTFYSHTNKPLEVHTERVTAGAVKRTELMIAKIAAIFHDLGKINPNFQEKLEIGKSKGYSSHAYLSALAWLSFCRHNIEILKRDLGGKRSNIYNVGAIIARHHGNLPNMDDGFLNETECERLRDFILQTDEKHLPISEFLTNCFPDYAHNRFSVKLAEKELTLLLDYPKSFRKEVLPQIENRLAYFLETQFAFASLIESDKRDASENKNYQNEKMSADVIRQFSTNLQTHIISVEEKAREQNNPKKKKLDVLRSKMREDSLANLRAFLKQDEEKRVFTLPAPTGAGKTLMLLSLTDEILKHRTDLSVIYALPFLAITEQTEKIAQDILKDENKVLRVDSKAENKEIANLQKELDSSPNDENVRKLLQQLFSHETFDHPFIITTFVQVFETLVSNRNAALLRLPNFSKTIFLLDEIQALPPSLYTFFVAYLDEFCRKFDSYAIVSTATMPHLELPDEENYDEIQKPSKIFRDYKPPQELLSYDFYKENEFNRYKIIPQFDEITDIETLAGKVKNQKNSCLIVLNTIKDTKNLFKALNPEADRQTEEGEYILLNTHFTLEDRQEKLRICNERLENKEKVVLISTQLIEAGVDIDFPIVYRDLCPLPNLIQTAGRCNRNYTLDYGEVYFFELKANGKKSSAYKIYGRNFDWFLSFTKQEINTELYEKDLLSIQKIFAEDKVNNALQFGRFKTKDSELNAIECISQIRFEDFGKLKLIDEEYGAELRVYTKHDGEFESLAELHEEGKSIPRRNFEKVKLHRQKIEVQIRKMTKKIVTVRLPEQALAEVKQSLCDYEEIFSINSIASETYYSRINGLRISFEGGEII